MKFSKIYAGSMGRADESISTSATKDPILQNSNGAFRIVDQASHNRVRHSAQSFIFIQDWFSK